MAPGFISMVKSFKLQASGFPEAPSTDHETASFKLDKLQAIGYYKIMEKYTLDEITGAWYEAYGEYIQDDYAGFIEILKKISANKKKLKK